MSSSASDTPPSETSSSAAEPLLKAPSALLMLLEGRAPWEFAALLAALPWLKQLPQGDGHPVIVYPGLSAGDITTLPLRRFLTQRGYEVHPWQQGLNFGPREGVLERCEAQLDAVHQRSGRTVSLVGWSLGGLYARELGKEWPKKVRSVITLGTPFSGHPRANNAWWLFEWLSGQSVSDPALIDRLAGNPRVPTTSIYSRSDGVVSWQCSQNENLPQTENIEVRASHVGMGMNPLALYALADRLAQPEGAWKAFEAVGKRRWFFKLSGREKTSA